MEVSPADLFTKHLPSKDKIHQLTSLFGCEYREGRAATTPLLRPNTANGQQGGHPPGDDGYEDPLPNFDVGEAQAHDPNVLPHHYDQDDMDRMCPQINAPPPIVNDEVWVPGENKWENDEDDDVSNNKIDEIKKRGHLWVAPEPRRVTGKRGKGLVRMNGSSLSHE